MKFIRNITLILISISLIGCVSSKPTNKSNRTSFIIELINHVPDKDLVDYFKVYFDYTKVMKSKSSTALEKAKANDMRELALTKLVLSSDTDGPAYQYNKKDEELVSIDLSQARINNSKRDIFEVILSLPTHKAARMIRVVFKQLADKKNNSNIKKR